jgi:hypothetical protein
MLDMGSDFFSANSPAYAWMSLAGYVIQQVIARKGPMWLNVAWAYPATWLHELMHAAIAKLNVSTVTEFKVTPTQGEDGKWSYGRVKVTGVAASIPFIRWAIAAAPAVFGPLIAMLIVQTILLPQSHGFWSGLGWWYLAFNMIYAAFMTSDSDVECMGPVMRVVLMWMGITAMLSFLADLPNAPCRYLGVFCSA